MGLLGHRTRRLLWARGPGPFGRRGPLGWPWMWRRWGSGANSSSISAWGRSRGSRNCRSNNGYNSSRHAGALWIVAVAVGGGAATVAAAVSGCDALKPGGPLTTRQLVEYKWTSGYPTPLQKIGQSLLCTGSSTQLQYLHILSQTIQYIQYIQSHE